MKRKGCWRTLTREASGQRRLEFSIRDAEAKEKKHHCMVGGRYESQNEVS